MGRNKKTSSKSAQSAKGESASVLSNIPQMNGFHKPTCGGDNVKPLPKRCAQHASTANKVENSNHSTHASLPDQMKTKKKKKKKDEEDPELQNLIDFIEGKDEQGKENTMPNHATKTAKKKKKVSKGVGKHIIANCSVKENGNLCAESNINNTKGDNDKNKKSLLDKEVETSDSKDKKSSEKCLKREQLQNGVSNECSKQAKTKKLPKKACKPLSKEEIEVMQLLQFIEGRDEQQQKQVDKENSDQNNNDSDDKKKKKKKKKKGVKEFDFNALRDNTHLEAKMLEEILREPTCVAEHRLFNPKQVALLFSKGHNEHWEQFPECDGRLKALERSSEGLSLADPGSKHLKIVIAELRRKRGKNITKSDLIEALKCHAYLHCEKCGYQSDIVVLQ